MADGHAKKIITAGVPLHKNGTALILLHGRGASAQDILGLAKSLHVKDFSLLAPQATNYTWYPFSFLSDPKQNEPWLSSALLLLADIEKELNETGIGSDKVWFAGFSQGSCVALEYVTRNAKKFGGVVAFSGGLIGDRIYPENYAGDFQQTPVFIGTSDPDPHIAVARANETAAVLQKMGADVLLKIYPDMGHTIIQDEIDAANKHVFSQ